jgi:rhamnogalacturonan endolyase
VAWSPGLGHPDHFYVGEIDPGRPGLEIYYGIEPGRKQNAMCLVDARTGRILWGHEEPTRHIHSSGLCSDVDPAHPGSECYSGERDLKDKRWLRDCKGRVLSTEDLGGLAPRAAYWDADPQRELLRRGRISKYKGPQIPPRVEGHIAAVADVLGDWREEIITSLPGELRIYTTTIPATDRRVCLMQDPLYRMDVVCAAMGYFQVPMTSYDLATRKR